MSNWNLEECAYTVDPHYGYTTYLKLLSKTLHDHGNKRRLVIDSSNNRRALQGPVPPYSASYLATKTQTILDYEEQYANDWWSGCYLESSGDGPGKSFTVHMYKDKCIIREAIFES